MKTKWYKYLNKMVHLKYPILEIWCCNKHTNQLLPSKLKFDTKLRKVVPYNLVAQLCTSDSRRQNIPPNVVCLFQPIKYKHLKHRFLATFGTCYSSKINAFFKAQMWQKAEEYVPKQVCQYSTPQVIAINYRQNMQSIACKF